MVIFIHSDFNLQYVFYHSSQRYNRTITKVPELVISLTSFSLLSLNRMKIELSICAHVPKIIYSRASVVKIYYFGSKYKNRLPNYIG